jgi:BED zinc finger
MEAELESIQHEPDHDSQQEHDDSEGETHIRSHVWSYFTRDPNFKENKKATCNLCKKSYVCSGGSTSNLSKHLKNKHNLQRTTSQEQQQQGLDIRDAFKMKKVIYLILFCFKNIFIILLNIII